MPGILYQDDDLLVLDKPPGMVVNTAESVKGETVQEWIALRFKSQITNPNFQKNIDSSHWSLSFGHCDFCSRAGIVHRIDKETSGILLVAKTPSAFIDLQRQFKERVVKKIYLALVHGTIPEEGTINAPVGRLPWNREHFGVVPGGKESVTKFKRISTFVLSSRGSASDRSDLYNKPACSPRFGEAGRRGRDCFAPQSKARNDNKNTQVSLVEVYPETGRTHQIRVHFKYLGYPLLGDYLYGGRIQSRDDRKEFPRVMLHAWKITFAHPATHEPLAFEAPIPDDMNIIIQKSQITMSKSQTNSK